MSRTGGGTHDRAAVAAGARRGPRPRDGREPAALSQPVRGARPDAAPHGAHRVERAVCGPVDPGFPRAAAAYGPHGCRVHIVRRRGVPFAAARLRPRVLLWGGFALLGLVWWVLCTRVWAIEAQISPALPAQEVMAPAERAGRAHRRAARRARHPPHPLAHAAAPAGYALFCAQHPRATAFLFRRAARSRRRSGSTRTRRPRWSPRGTAWSRPCMRSTGRRSCSRGTRCRRATR